MSTVWMKSSWRGHEVHTKVAKYILLIFLTSPESSTYVAAKVDCSKWNSSWPLCELLQTLNEHLSSTLVQITYFKKTPEKDTWRALRTTEASVVSKYTTNGPHTCTYITYYPILHCDSVPVLFDEQSTVHNNYVCSMYVVLNIVANTISVFSETTYPHSSFTKTEGKQSWPEGGGHFVACDLASSSSTYVYSMLVGIQRF